MSDKSALASRYAQAVIEAMVDRWQSALGAVESALSSDSALSSLMKDSTKSLDEKTKALEAALPDGASAEVANLLKLMVQDGSTDLISGVSAALGKVASGRSGPVKAEIVSAVALSEPEQEQIRSNLTAQHGADLVFNFRVDPTLLGGLRVRVGDHLTDTSVVSRLNSLRDTLMTSSR
jgi:F-type H+-transporting ATPase subunit delta